MPPQNSVGLPEQWKDIPQNRDFRLVEDLAGTRVNNFAIHDGEERRGERKPALATESKQG